MSALQMERAEHLCSLVLAAGRSAEDSGRTIKAIRENFGALQDAVAQATTSLPYAKQRAGKRLRASEFTGTGPETGVAENFDLPAVVRDFDACPS